MACKGFEFWYVGGDVMTKPGSAGFTEAKHDGGGVDNWSYKSCKAAVKSSPPTNQHQTFYRPDALPDIRRCRSTEGKRCSDWVSTEY